MLNLNSRDLATLCELADVYGRNPFPRGSNDSGMLRRLAAHL